jgi:uncharacterized membrane protein
MMKLRMLAGLLLVGLLVLSPATVVLAQDETPTETITLSATYSKLEALAGAGFEFEVNLEYAGGTEARTFDLIATGPQDWNVYVTPTYPTDKQILNILLEPVQPYQTAPVTKVLIHVSPPYWLLPEPGDYPVTLEVASGDLSATINLTAVVTASYQMALTTPDGLLNTTATAGRDNYFSIEVQNTGSAEVDDINFSTIKPSGWAIDFSPAKLDSIAALDSQTVQVNIKPPDKTIAGDYQITITAKGKQVSDDINIRVSVETPSIWGWVGVAIIVVVIAGLVYIFMRFSRR